MKRPIRFRAWNSDKEEMGYFGLDDVDRVGDSDDLEFSLSDQAGKYLFGISTLDIGFATMMQFTGLTDKNGKEIYEGDVVAFRQMVDGVQKGKFVNHAVVYFGNVGYGNYEGGFETVGFALRYVDGEMTEGLYDLNWKENEIIGNIHENPELVK